MREIKFRIFNKTEKKYIYSNKFNFDGFFRNLELFFQFISAKEVLLSEFGEIQQYTGIKDEDDIDIYEGDILEIFCISRPNLVEVIFEKGAFNFKGWYLNGENIGIDELSGVIVGNRHENPELLTKIGVFIE